MLKLNQETKEFLLSDKENFLKNVSSFLTIYEPKNKAESIERLQLKQLLKVIRETEKLFNESLMSFNIEIALNHLIEQLIYQLDLDEKQYNKMIHKDSIIESYLTGLWCCVEELKKHNLISEEEFGESLRLCNLYVDNDSDQNNENYINYVNNLLLNLGYKLQDFE